MRDPTRKEIREILERLRDDKPHFTGDLFPGIEGDALIERSELIIRMGEFNYVSYQSVSSAGFHKVPRGVAGIRIRPEGHGWLEHDRTIHGYAERTFTKRAAEIARDYETQVSAIRAEGDVSQSIYIDALAEAVIGRMERIAKAKADSMLEAYERAGLALTRDILEEIVLAVSQACWNARWQEVEQIKISNNNARAFGQTRRNSIS